MYPITGLFSPELSPSAFHDKQIRSKVQAMPKKAATNKGQPPAKRIKVSTPESNCVPFIMARLSKVLDVPATEALRNIEDSIL